MVVSSSSRLLVASVVVAASAPFLLTRDLLPKVLLGACVVGVVLWLAMGDDGPGATPSLAFSRSISSSADPIDPEAYAQGAQVRISALDRDLPRRLPHLALRDGGKLLERVRAAARIGAKYGNTGSGVRAMAVLEDLFRRYHSSMLSEDVALASRTLERMRYGRTIALNALEDLVMQVPSERAKAIREASEAVRQATLVCMSTLVARHAPSRSPVLDASQAAFLPPFAATSSLSTEELVADRSRFH